MTQEYKETSKVFTAVADWQFVYAFSKTVGSGPFYKAIYTDYRYSQKNPKWRHQVSHHQDATTPFTGVKVLVDSEPYFITEHTTRVCNFDPEPPAQESFWFGDHPRSGGGFFPLEDPSSIDFTLANRIALEQLVKKLRNVDSPMRGAVFLGQIGETLHDIRHPAKALRDGIDKYIHDVKKHRHIRHVPTLNRAIADTWLQYAYGFRPLVQDIDGACKALANLLYNPTPLQRVVAYGTDEQVLTYPEWAAWQLGHSSLSWDLLHTSTASVRYIAAVKIDVDNPVLLASSLFGFDPNQFLPTVWELIPYSFLIDYFTNIGNIIDAWSFPRSRVAYIVKTKLGTAGYKLATFRPKWGYYNDACFQTKTGSYDAGKLNVRAKFVERSPYANSLVPDLELSVPGAGSTRWLNIAALSLSRAFSRL